MSQIIGKCRCGGYVRWIPLFGPNKELGGCDKCKEFRFFANANATPQPAAAQGGEPLTYTELAEAGDIVGCNGRHPAEYRCYEGCKATPPAHGDGEVVLPELPFPDTFTSDSFNGMKLYFTAEQMREYARQVLTTRPTPEAQEARDSCVWTFDDDDRAPMWNSACGEAWSFTEGGPEDNSYRYCHGCGKPIAALALPAQGEGSC